jgi:hypothetical protein
MSHTAYLLQLLILEIATNHHLQHNEQLTIANVPIAVNIIDLERIAHLFILDALGTERAKAVDEFLEVDVAAAVFVKDGDHPSGQRVRGDLGKSEKLLAFNRARVVLVKAPSVSLAALW